MRKKNILNLLKYKEENTPHTSGKVKCLNCEYEWVAVAPTGKLWLKCPKCKIEKGTWVSPVERDEPHWQCKCGNWLFYVTSRGIYCPSCGNYQKGF